MTRLVAPFDAPGLALLAALALALLAPPLVPYEPLWEIAASFGWAALAATILTFRIVPLARRGGLTPYRYSLHRTAGHLALALVAAHALTMIAGDPFVVEYLGWAMPRHVLAGLLAALAFLLATASREPALPRRLRLGGGSRGFHSWAGIAAGGLTAWHVLASSTKLVGAWRYALMALLFVALLAPSLQGRLGLARRVAAAPPTGEPFGRVGTGGVARLVAVLAALALLLGVAPHLVAHLRAR